MLDSPAAKSRTNLPVLSPTFWQDKSTQQMGSVWTCRDRGGEGHSSFSALGFCLLSRSHFLSVDLINPFDLRKMCEMVRG